MKTTKRYILADQIHTKAIEIFRIYNSVVRTPTNWQEELARLKANPNSRAAWKYRVPKGIRQKLTTLRQLYTIFISLSRQLPVNVYDRFLPDVVKATVDTAVIKCDILENLRDGPLQQTVDARRGFYGIDFGYANIIDDFDKLSQDPSLKEIGRALGMQDTSAEQARLIVRRSIAQVRTRIETVVRFPATYRDQMRNAFTADVDVVDDPSFSMRCVTDPKTLTTRILLNRRRRYSMSLLKLAYLHEFCGHALEMAIFDKTLVRQGILPQIYSYAGVSSPNIFDVKAEVLADLIVVPFVTKADMTFVRYRRDVWLICRAMADYLYHIKGLTIQSVMQIYKKAGLTDFAFDEAIMASIFVDGYQGMYLFANRQIERLQRENSLTDNEMLIFLLYMGKIPIDRFSEFRHLFRVDSLDRETPDCYTKKQSERVL